MALRCFVFTSDEGTAALIRQILADLGVEADPCADAVVAADKITHQNFQIVIIDWDKQPEAALLLTTARERKAAERALTLAIVSDEKNVPVVLQAGANSILRKPIAVGQAKDTLTTARDLLRAKQDSAAGASHAAAAGASAAPSSLPQSPEQSDRPSRGGEFLVAAPGNPGAHSETEPDLPLPSGQSSATPVEALRDLESMAVSIVEKSPDPSPSTSPAAPAQDQPRGLEWYLKTRVAAQPASPASSGPPAPRGNPELLGYDQIPAQPVKRASDLVPAAPKPNPPAPAPRKETRREEQKKEAVLFAYMDGERAEPSPTRFHLGKRAIFGALVLASLAVAAAPQAPWHPKLRILWHTGQKSARAWLNPQPLTAVHEAPPAHEELYRPGDEYKLPVAENIPDATTDPSQIQVVPIVDPTAKKPNPDAANSAQGAATDGSVPADQAQPQTALSPDIQPAPAASAPAQPVVVTPTPAAASQHGTVIVASASLPPQPVSLPAASPAPPTTPPKPSPQPRYVSPAGTVPQSLRSQLAPATPDPVSKPADTPLPSIEPVTVSESAGRSLLVNQPPIPYPATAKAQQGTVVLQVLVGRDGTVQDAKFFQGSFLFARTAIDGVKQWKFKPYILNGRPVSIQTTLTMKFKPGQ